MAILLWFIIHNSLSLRAPFSVCFVQFTSRVSPSSSIKTWSISKWIVRTRDEVGGWVRGVWSEWIARRPEFSVCLHYSSLRTLTRPVVTWSDSLVVMVTFRKCLFFSLHRPAPALLAGPSFSDYWFIVLVWPSPYNCELSLGWETTISIVSKYGTLI